MSATPKENLAAMGFVDSWAVEPQYDEPHDHAIRFLNRLAPDEAATFQVFDDAKQGRVPAVVRHGTLQQHWRGLKTWNDQGAGVYVMLNRGNGQGRRAENVVAVRALFVDLDGAPLKPVLDAEPKAHLVSETSPGRFHAVWLVADCELGQFSDMQKALAVRFGGDAAVNDLPRVVRLPGFWHMKGKPQLSRLLCEQFAPSYKLADIVAGLGLKVPEQPPVISREPVRPVGELNTYCEAAIRKAYARIVEAPAGQQETTLNKEAFGLASLVGAWGMPPALALDVLHKAAQKMPSHDRRRPWRQRELDRKIKDAFTAGLRHPREARSG
jgi:hypothetical protein